MREAEIKRNTKETKIDIKINIDGKGIFSGKTPIPFFDHMLTHFSRYSMIDLNIQAAGDIEIDGHHTIEDTGIVLGEAIKKAVGDKRGIYRFGNAVLPMDETLVSVSVDFSGRPYFAYRGPSLSEMPGFGIYDAELTSEFLQKLSIHASLNLHVVVQYGENRHHIHEAIYKAVGLSFRQALEKDIRRGDEIPSTKGII
ncbi:MAG: imidazoleglycerol-phosphate dehydratase HisB [Spirochaetia bacterium]|nr:imidazoleglycerol-phosphate dehydratase HisB [Spirochaetia bacterium]